MRNATDDKTKKDRLLEIYRKFRPAFRFFFLENFTDPCAWTNARLAYTHSVAVTSIVGYILGEWGDVCTVRSFFPPEFCCFLMNLLLVIVMVHFRYSELGLECT